MAPEQSQNLFTFRVISCSRPVLFSFQVYTADWENPCGHITKQWSGLGKELFTDADNFGVTFPRDLDVTVKAVIMGACFLIVSYGITLMQLVKHD